jgi:hypothetical protein
MRKFLTLNGIILLGLGFTGLKAQEAVTTSGGEATGSGGTVSYTVGQALYTTHTANEGSVVHGVQQPYEISVVTSIEEAEGISLTMVAYPNPTNDVLKLRVDGYQGEHLTYRIYDTTGKLLEAGRVTGDITHLTLGSKPPAMYLLRVFDNQKEVKVYRIIKN